MAPPLVFAASVLAIVTRLDACSLLDNSAYSSEDVQPRTFRVRNRHTCGCNRRCGAHTVPVNALGGGGATVV